MTESEFDQLANSVFVKIEQAIDAEADDVDYMRSGNVLEIEFDNGSKIIVNRHDANQEIWLAARSGGFHFGWQDNCWFSQRDQVEFYTKLGQLFAESGETVNFIN